MKSLWLEGGKFDVSPNTMGSSKLETGQGGGYSWSQYKLHIDRYVEKSIASGFTSAGPSIYTE